MGNLRNYVDRLRENHTKVIESSTREEWLEKQEASRPVTSKDIEIEMQGKVEALFTDNKIQEVNNEVEALIGVNKTIIDKSGRLKKLGFHNTPTVENVNNLETTIRSKKSEIEITERELNYTKQYTIEFPGYKFVPERIFNEVCEKYNLLTSSTDRYIKEIPEKNLGEIENFMPLVKVNSHSVTYQGWGHAWGLGSVSTVFIGNESECIEAYNREKDKFGDKALMVGYNPRNLLITAPIDHFNLENSEVRGRRIEDRVLDPIVSHPVDGGVIIVTAWDKEAEIPEIQNPMNN